MALLLEHHVHRLAAKAWWQASGGPIAFTRVTQISLLRLLTTAGAMDGQPLGMQEAWRIYDRLFEDDRVVLFAEPAGVELRFRDYTSGKVASPKVWADAWLLAFAEAAGGAVVTFDRALGGRGAGCVLLEPGAVP
jgi:toxin-antitoxin system PIN domain toxin